jgi:hypothetical protein
MELVQIPDETVEDFLNEIFCGFPILGKAESKSKKAGV